MDIRTHTTPAPIPSVSIAKPGEERDNLQAHRRVPPPTDVKADNKVRERNDGQAADNKVREQNDSRTADNQARERNIGDENSLGVREQGKLPAAPQVRLELRIDDETKKVFGRVVDKNSGEEIRQIPAESIRQLQAISRELFGALIDVTV